MQSERNPQIVRGPLVAVSLLICMACASLQWFFADEIEERRRQQCDCPLVQDRKDG